MRQALSHDPSTLATLRPTESREVHYKSFRTSPRLSGSHFMTLRRVSRVPEAGREYVPGDPPHLIDWKAYARTDQLIVREVRDEAAARVVVGLDLSETMRWPESETASGAPPSALVTKAEIALRVAFNLAHLHLRMGDLVEIWGVAGGERPAPDLRLAPRSPADLVSSFDRIEAHGFASEAALLDFAPATFGVRPYDCVFWVGDALSAADHGAFLARGKRSMLLHVLSSLELDIGWIQGATSYFDEGRGRREYQGEVLRQRDNYVTSLTAWRQKLEADQRQRGGDYVTLSDKTLVAAYQQALSGFFAAFAKDAGQRK